MNGSMKMGEEKKINKEEKTKWVQENSSGLIGRLMVVPCENCLA